MNHVICDTGNTWTERCTVNESRLSNEFLMMIFFHFFVNKVLLFYHLPRILALEIVARIFVELFQLSLKVLSQDFAFDWRPGDVCNWEFALNRCKGRWKTRHRGQPISSTPASPANAWLEPRTTSEWCSPATSAPDLATAPDPETDSQAVQSTFTAPWASNKPAVPGPPTEMAPAVPGYTGGSAGIGGHPKPGAERVPREDGGMVELTPLYRSIFDRPYFHIISRNKSREMLEKGRAYPVDSDSVWLKRRKSPKEISHTKLSITAEDGVFLIRPSTRSSDPLTLCLRYRSRTYNINIRCRPDGLFALGSEKTNEMVRPLLKIDSQVKEFHNDVLSCHNVIDMTDG